VLHLKFTINKSLVLDNISDKLISQCKKGNRKAQKELYLLSVDRLKLIGWRYCPNIHDAQDVVQNSYLLIFKSINQFDSKKGDFKAWSAKIVVNEALQLLKKKNRIVKQSFDGEPYIAVSEINFGKYQIEEVKRVVSLLKTPQRIIFNMYFFESYSYAEIGSFLKIKESSARGNVSRAKKAFVEIWRKFDKVIAL